MCAAGVYTSCASNIVQECRIRRVLELYECCCASGKISRMYYSENDHVRREHLLFFLMRLTVMLRRFELMNVTGEFLGLSESVSQCVDER